MSRILINDLIILKLLKQCCSVQHIKNNLLKGTHHNALFMLVHCTQNLNTHVRRINILYNCTVSVKKCNFSFL